MITLITQQGTWPQVSSSPHSPHLLLLLRRPIMQAVPPKVVREGLRPRFPPDTPLHYK